MRALVMWESTFGNTRKIADSIVEGLAPTVEASAVEADRFEPWMLGGVGLVVVGAPTHMFRLPDARSRQTAVRRAPGRASHATSGIREWLDDPAQNGKGTVAATFDTRFARPHWLTGSAARGAAKRLTALGYHVIATESFFVTGSEGPLRKGETERARAWAEQLAASIASVGR